MTHYLVVNTFTLNVIRVESAHGVAAQMLGRQFRNYVIIKSDKDGNRTYTPSNPDVTIIEKELEAL